MRHKENNSLKGMVIISRPPVPYRPRIHKNKHQHKESEHKTERAPFYAPKRFLTLPSNPKLGFGLFPFTKM